MFYHSSFVAGAIWAIGSVLSGTQGTLLMDVRTGFYTVTPLIFRAFAVTCGVFTSTLCASCGAVAGSSKVAAFLTVKAAGRMTDELEGRVKLGVDRDVVFDTGIRSTGISKM
jgi:hypothetical protein